MLAVSFFSSLTPSSPFLPPAFDRALFGVPVLLAMLLSLITLLFLPARAQRLHAETTLATVPLPTFSVVHSHTLYRFSHAYFSSRTCSKGLRERRGRGKISSNALMWLGLWCFARVNHSTSMPLQRIHYAGGPAFSLPLRLERLSPELTRARAPCG